MWLRTKMRTFSTLPFFFQSISLGSKLMYSWKLSDFCQTLHPRSRCWASSQCPVLSKLSLLLIYPSSLLLCPNLWTFLSWDMEVLSRCIRYSPKSRRFMPRVSCQILDLSVLSSLFWVGEHALLRCIGERARGKRKYQEQKTLIVFQKCYITTEVLSKTFYFEKFRLSTKNKIVYTKKWGLQNF